MDYLEYFNMMLGLSAEPGVKLYDVAKDVMLTKSAIIALSSVNEQDIDCATHPLSITIDSVDYNVAIPN